MATKKSGAKRPAPKKRVASARPSKSDLVALTVKVDHDFYIRLCTVGASLRRTNQDILYEAVKEYIDKAEA